MFSFLGREGIFKSVAAHTGLYFNKNDNYKKNLTKNLYEFAYIYILNERFIGSLSVPVWGSLGRSKVPAQLVLIMNFAGQLLLQGNCCSRIIVIS
jgi:hypothetical protein